MKVLMILAAVVLVVALVTAIPAFAQTTVTANPTSTSSANANVINQAGQAAVKSPLQIPGGALPGQTLNFIQPMATEFACSVFLPSEMTVSDACKCAGKNNGDSNNVVVNVLYTMKEDVGKRMQGTSLADYIGMASEKDDVYLPSLCKVVCKLGTDGAKTVIVTKLAPTYEGVTKARGLGMGGTGGGAGSAIAGGGLLGITWGTARNFLEEKVSVVAIGFKNKP